MATGVRKSLIVGALLLAFALGLWLRSDVVEIKNHLDQELSQFADIKLSAGQSSLTFMHGIGLRLDAVKLEHHLYQAEASHINLNLRLLPLLLGKVEVDSLDMHDARIQLKSDGVQLSSASISTLPVEHIHLIRSSIIAADGTELLNNLHMELRDIGPDRETLWELNAAQADQSLSGHGRLLFRAGDIASGFGRLKLDKMPVSKLQTVAPDTVINWFEAEDDHISGTLTLDITRQQTWAVFGEVQLASRQRESTLKLRGKLSHPANGVLVWRDSFIHFDEQAVIAIEGTCKREICDTRLDAKNIPLAKWAAFIPQSVTFHRQVSGITDLVASLEWSNKGWSGHGSFQLKKGSFKFADEQISLPDITLESSELAGNAKTWRAKAVLFSPTTTGAININSAVKVTGVKDMYLETAESDSSLWQPLANLLLASLDLEPELNGAGKINGKLHLQQYRGKKTLALEIDARQAELSYASLFSKPADTSMSGRAVVKFSDNVANQIKLENYQLGTSALASLNWLRDAQQQSVAINKLSVNFDQLKTQAIQLPEPMQDLKGMLEGNGKTSWKQKMQQWAGHLSGEWRLQNFGRDQWHVNGSVSAADGLLKSKRLLLDGSYGQAELSGSYEPDKQRGHIDIISGSLNWEPEIALPESWQHLSLTGRIRNTRLQFLDNEWQGLSAAYSFKKGALQLQKLKATLAGGMVSSTGISLRPEAEALSLNGQLRGKNIVLQKLTGLNEWLQADLSGKLHANISLHGRIPHSGLSDWQHSNGDILIYSGQWRQQPKPESLTERLGIKTPELKSYDFRKLEFRFRIGEKQADIPSIDLIRHEQHYRGKASISSDMNLTGLVRNTGTDAQTSIQSTLPHLNWDAQ